MKSKIEYAVYKGDEFLYIGTAKECAKYFNVSEKTVSFWATPVNFKRAEKAKKMKVAVRLN